MANWKEKVAAALNGASANGDRWRRLRQMFGDGSPEPAAADLYLRLAVQLALERSPGERAKSILLTSPTSGPIVRDTGMELAYVLAERMGRRVLMIEADFGNCQDLGPGVTDLLAEGVHRLPELVRTTRHERVFSLPPGSPSLAPASFTTGRHAELMDKACASYDSVLLLGAPVLTDSRWLVFAPLVDHSLLLAVEGRTFVSDLDASLQALSECKAAGVGVVLTRESREAHP